MSRVSARKKKKNPIVILLLVAVIIAVAAFAGVNLYLSGANKPLDPTAEETFVNVTIPTGTGTGQIGTILEEQNIVKSGSSFKLIAKTKGYDGKFKAGEYSLSPSMSAEAIMKILVGGNSNTKRFTVPEGLTLMQTAEKLATDGIVNLDAFLLEAESGDFDHKFMEALPSGQNRLEGFLYPETYDIYTTATERDVIKRMLDQFDTIYKDEYYARATELGYDINKVITIASMIERETKVTDEMALVSSVIYNRIEVGMPLQIDATVQYALAEHKDRLTYEDLKVDSPYNTYKNKGLPPGPICSPSVSAIEAALYPADTDYFYYVLSSANDGSHQFTNSYSDFLKYKNEYINSL